MIEQEEPRKNLSVPLPVSLIDKLKEQARKNETLLKWYVERLLREATERNS